MWERKECNTCLAVPVDSTALAAVPVEGTVETKDQEDTVAKEETTVVKEENEEEVTVIDAPSPTVIPGPAKNFMEFVEHFKALKHDPTAFGNYFLVSFIYLLFLNSKFYLNSHEIDAFPGK